MISVKTTIGIGSIKQGTEKTHGSPLGDEDLANVKKKFGLNPEEKFAISEDVAKTYSNMKAIGKEKEDAWNELFKNYGMFLYISLMINLRSRFCKTLYHITNLVLLSSCFLI